MKLIILVILISSLIVENYCSCSYQPIQFELLAAEGVCPCAYFDSKQKKTIGIGKLIENDDYLKEVQQILDITDQELKNLSDGSLVLNPLQIRELLDYSVSQAEESAKNLIASFDYRQNTMRYVLIDLQFNGNLLQKFQRFTNYINQYQIENAIQELIYTDPKAKPQVKSPYCSDKDTKARCEKNVNLLSNCLNQNPDYIQNTLEKSDKDKCLQNQELTKFCKFTTNNQELVFCQIGFKQLQKSDAKSYDDYCKQNYQINLQISKCSPDSLNSLNTAYKIPTIDDWVWILQAQIKPQDSKDYKCYQLYKQFYDDANMIANVKNKVSGNVSYAINYINTKKKQLKKYCVNSDLYQRVLNHYREIKKNSLNELDLRIINGAKKNCNYLQKCNFDFKSDILSYISDRNINNRSNNDNLDDTTAKLCQQLIFYSLKLLFVMYLVF
ncbi:hypothetical protein ABPG72_001975 [Tetrahymena utriculariae]